MPPLCLQVEPLDWREWLVSIALGAVSLPLSQALRLGARMLHASHARKRNAVKAGSPGILHGADGMHEMNDAVGYGKKQQQQLQGREGAVPEPAPAPGYVGYAVGSVPLRAGQAGMADVHGVDVERGVNTRVHP